MTEINVKAKYYCFGQNNSGGSFTYRPNAGIGHFVIVEALDYRHANARAEQIGLYFNGCDSGMDCSCCGDRWSAQWSEDSGNDTPMVYGAWSPDDYVADPTNPKWNMEKQVFVHYISGQITAY